MVTVPILRMRQSMLYRTAEANLEQPSHAASDAQRSQRRRSSATCDLSRTDRQLDLFEHTISRALGQVVNIGPHLI